MEMCTTIKTVLSFWVIRLCNVQVVINGFAHLGFPHCTGAIVGTQVSVLCPHPTSGLRPKGVFLRNSLRNVP